MRAVLEARPLDRRTRLDLVRGALDAHAHPRTPPTVPVLAGARRGPRLDRRRSGERPPAGRARLAGLPARDAADSVLIGAIAASLVVMAIGRRSGLEPPGGTDAGTGARVRRSRPVGRRPRDRRRSVVRTARSPEPAQSAAAIGTIAVGLVRWRVGDRPLADAVLLAGDVAARPVTARLAGRRRGWIAIAVATLVRPLRDAAGLTVSSLRADRSADVPPWRGRWPRLRSPWPACSLAAAARPGARDGDRRRCRSRRAGGGAAPGRGRPDRDGPRGTRPDRRSRLVVGCARPGGRPRRVVDPRHRWQPARAARPGGRSPVHEDVVRSLRHVRPRRGTAGGHRRGAAVGPLAGRAGGDDAGRPASSARIGRSPTARGHARVRY